jgi:hypothetical protein
VLILLSGTATGDIDGGWILRLKYTKKAQSKMLCALKYIIRFKLQRLL